MLFILIYIDLNLDFNVLIHRFHLLWMRMINPHKEVNSKGTMSKYLPSSSLIQSKNLKSKPEISNIHCRSM